MAKKKLKTEHRKFADIYRAMTPRVAYKAYMKVYPNCDEAGARRSASALLTKIDIQAYIEEQDEKLFNKYEVTNEKIMEGLAKQAFGNPFEIFDENGNLKDIKDISQDLFLAMDVTVKDGEAEFSFKGSARKGALDTLAKIKGLMDSSDGEESTKKLDDYELTKNIVFLLRQLQEKGK